MSSGALRGVALDLDGTLLRSDHSVSAEMRSLCSALTRKGILLTLISSRPPRSVEEIAGDLGLEGPWAALNGAFVFGAGREILDRSPLPQASVERLLARYGRDDRVSLNLYAGFDWIVQSVDRRVWGEAEIIGFAPTVDVGFASRPVTEKILMITDEGGDDGARLAEELEAFDDDVAVARSKQNYIEITRSKIDKGRALAFIAASRGLSAREMAAAGDGENDIPMLKACGYPIAMGHGPRSLRQIAELVVGSNDDGSLTEALGRLFGLLPSP
ncbi:Cof-type HAD-IIB family hydrolase [Sorangium sp. So ce1335]|uniref:Cof-type HAD-IIB family hydrolase n=1 Tax=Sorangium sp. So ce1335 TaxID=3133335 RepID=UPI003F5F301E